MPIDLEELERRLQLRGKAAWNGSELGRLRVSAELSDAVPALIAEVRRLRALLDASEESARLHYESAEQVRSEAQNAIDALRAEVRRLRAEVERRPEITPEDAAHMQYVKVPASLRGIDAAYRMEAALRAHAAKVKPQCSCSRRLGDYCPDVDGSCPIHGDAAKVTR